MLALRIVVVAVGLWTSAALGSPLQRSEPPNSYDGRRSVDPYRYGANDDILSELSTYLRKRAPPGEKRAQDDEAVAAIHSGLERTIHGDHAKRDISLDDLIDFISSFVDEQVDNLADLARVITDSGILPEGVADFLNGYLEQEINSINNKNTREPKRAIYPSKSPQDAPYSVNETALRSAIHIPSSFEYGRNGKKPVIFVPGTAVNAGSTFHFAFEKSFADAGDLGDPVWINIPGASLDDVQVNSEYVAYAINYISSISGGNNTNTAHGNNSTTKVTVISFSQGGINTQWALSYWPSTREVVEDFIAVSPDFGGTDLGIIACPPVDPLAEVTCIPAFKQQYSGSNLIELLQTGDARRAYVPTTTVYSSTDTIVQPQSGDNASAIIHPRPGVQVSNNMVQDVCEFQLAGSIYTHELVLVNPVTWELIVDAMTHEGPGDTERIDWLKLKVCNTLYAPTLDLDDAIGTQGLLVIAAANIVRSDDKVTEEPPIKAYAK